jgi:hypothetical protein
VLGIPPAFILSQDQTLHNNMREPFRIGSVVIFLRLVTRLVFPQVG